MKPTDKSDNKVRQQSPTNFSLAPSGFRIHIELKIDKLKFVGHQKQE